MTGELGQSRGVASRCRLVVDLPISCSDLFTSYHVSLMTYDEPCAPL